MQSYRSHVGLCINSILNMATMFTADDLINMPNVCFLALEDTIPDTLADISIIQASQAGTANAVPSDISNCKGSCSSYKCRCKRQDHQCSTKCHLCVVGLCMNLTRLLYISVIFQYCMQWCYSS